MTVRLQLNLISLIIELIIYILFIVFPYFLKFKCELIALVQKVVSLNPDPSTNPRDNWVLKSLLWHKIVLVKPIQ